MAIKILKTGCKQTSKRKTANDGNARMRKQSRGESIALILSSRWWKSNDNNMLYHSVIAVWNDLALQLQ